MSSGETDLDAQLEALSLERAGESAVDPTITTDDDGVISIDLGGASSFHRDTGEVASGAEPNELARFRKEWEAEVKARKDGVSVGPVRWKSEAQSSTGASAPSSSKTNKDDHAEPQGDRAGPSRSTTWRGPQDREVQSGSLSRVAVESNTIRQISAVRAKKSEDAVEIYARAVENEQSGQLSEALQLYRKAFKLNGKSASIHLQDTPYTAQIMLTASTLDHD